MSLPYVDWDRGIHTIEEYRKRYTNTVTEMRASLLVNFVFSLFMMCPLWYTGEYYPLTNKHSTCFLSACNIRARHESLAGLISTKTEEDLSLENMNQLLAALTTCMLTFSALEAGFYFIYNKMVDNKDFNQ